MCPVPDSVIQIQNVDDLLIAAPQAALCLQATRAVLFSLHEGGFKVSREKLQLCRRSVTFLGRVVGSDGLAMSAAHR